LACCAIRQPIALIGQPYRDINNYHLITAFQQSSELRYHFGNGMVVASLGYDDPAVLAAVHPGDTGFVVWNDLPHPRT
jgi:hypothetical protein